MNQREELLAKMKRFFGAKEDSSDFAMQRQELLTWIKAKKDLILYVLLAAVIWFSSYLRLQNLPILKDVTTGELLTTELDTHLFVKYAHYILEHGSLLAHDPTRYVPLGTSTMGYSMMSHFLANFYKFIHFFNPAVTLEYTTVIYPVIAFAVAMLIFFFLIRRLFDEKVALLATLFLSLVPAFLQRTTAGFSDHEALGIVFMFTAMYFYVVGWQKKTTGSALIYGSLAGIFTGLMGLTWGGWKFLILIISIFVLIEFFFNKVEVKDIYQYGAWVIFFTITTTTFIPMFNLKILLSSFTTGVAYLAFFMLLVDWLIVKYDPFKLKEKIGRRMPLRVASFVATLILGILVIAVFFGATGLTKNVNEIKNNLLHPLGNDRWQLTVAEQQQPYFTTWIAEFGPSWFNIPLYLTLFLLGSVLVFYAMVRDHRQKLLMAIIYILFILGFAMSRYAPDSSFNGVNFISKSIYIGSLVVFAGLGVYFYFNSFYKNKEEYQKILAWEKRYIFVLVWFILMVIAARGAIRLHFMLSPISAVMASYATVSLGRKIFHLKTPSTKYVLAVILIAILLSPFLFPTKGIIPSFAKQTADQARYSGPPYNQQWQHTGKWARENIPANAVFGHWWDYGYWVQNGFKRASVLDGANKIVYWNYLMGRHVLTARNQTEALQFLKVHQTTHFLIVADEIGKYTAYSSIGSDKDYDRFSWISIFVLNEKETQETRNATLLMYPGVSNNALDDDFTWNGKVFPGRNAGIGAIFLPFRQSFSLEDGQNVTRVQFDQPTAALVYKGQRTDVPVECLYINGQFLTFPNPGLKGCFRIIPTLTDQGQIANLLGAGLYVSEEGVNSLWTNLYLFDQKNPAYDTSAFTLVYGDDKTYAPLSLFRGQVIGPQKIWEIHYPTGFSVDAETTKNYLAGNEMLPDYFFQVN